MRRARATRSRQAGRKSQRWGEGIEGNALTDREIERKSSMYDVSRRAFPHTECLRHAAARVVITKENTAHDGPRPKGKARIIK